MSYTINELSELVAEYLATKNDEAEGDLDSITDRGFAQYGAEGFLEWLKERVKHESAQSGSHRTATCKNAQ